jgi:pyridoxal phosphate enzyme (YggS family)
VDILQNYLKVKRQIDQTTSRTKLIVVCKNQEMINILPLINSGQIHFGENRVQDAKNKWQNISSKFLDVKLHFIGKVQSNKINDIFRIFHYVHSLDSEKLAKSFSEYEIKQQRKLSYFIQVNIGSELQKSGILVKDCENFVSLCKNLKLNILGLMCIPPANKSPDEFFLKMNELNMLFGFKELSMGMSSDYLKAIKFGSTFVRVGSAIFS